jgi:hypothetical protein
MQVKEVNKTARLAEKQAMLQNWPHTFTFYAHLVKTQLRFQVLMAVTMKAAVFWDGTPCSMVESLPTFQKCLFAPIMKAQGGSISISTMKAVNTSETSVIFYQPTRRNTPQVTFISTVVRIKDMLIFSRTEHALNRRPNPSSF